MKSERPVIAALGEVLWDLFPDGAKFGGAPANYAHHASALGAEVHLLTALGADDLGARATEHLSAMKISLESVQSHSGYPTGSVRVTVSSDGQASYRFGEDEAWDHLLWQDDLLRIAGACDAVCFGTLGQRAAESRDVIQRFVRSTKSDAIRVLDLNLRPPFVSSTVIQRSLELSNTLKLNDDELEVCSDLFSLTGNSVNSKLSQLAARFELDVIVLTLGQRGAVMFDHGLVFKTKARVVEVQDTVGAGDSFTARITCGLLAQEDAESMLDGACRLAEFVCTESGATPKVPFGLVPEFSRNWLRAEQ
jgi:fructokinase